MRLGGNRDWLVILLALKNWGAWCWREQVERPRPGGTRGSCGHELSGTRGMVGLSPGGVSAPCPPLVRS